MIPISSVPVKQMNNQLLTVVNFVLTVVGAFVFGYKAMEYASETPSMPMVSGLWQYITCKALHLSKGRYQNNLNFSKGRRQNNLYFSKGRCQNNLYFSKGRCQNNLYFSKGRCQNNLYFSKGRCQNSFSVFTNLKVVAELSRSKALFHQKVHSCWVRVDVKNSPLYPQMFHKSSPNHLKEPITQLVTFADVSQYSKDSKTVNFIHNLHMREV